MVVAFTGVNQEDDDVDAECWSVQIDRQAKDTNRA